MGLRVNRRALLVGVIAVLVSVLAFLLVPTIMAVQQVGIVGEDLTTCSMIDPDTKELGPEDSEPLIAPMNSNEYPEKNAVMKCEAQISANNVPYMAESIDGTPCIVALGDGEFKSTDSWKQTVSASGQSILICRFNTNK